MKGFMMVVWDGYVRREQESALQGPCVACCSTGKLLGMEVKKHPELRVKGAQHPCRGSGAAPLRKVWDLNKVPRRVRGRSP